MNGARRGLHSTEDVHRLNKRTRRRPEAETTLKVGVTGFLDFVLRTGRIWQMIWIFNDFA